MLIGRRAILEAVGVTPMLGLASLLDGCNSSPKSFTIGMVTFPGYAPLYVAKDLGLFAGREVNLVRIESIGDMRAAMLANRIDAYLATYDIFQSIERAPPVGKLVYAIDTSVGADGVAVDPGITDVGQLAGAKIAAEPGFPPHFVLTYILYKHGRKLSEAVLRDMASADIPSAFAGRQINVAATYEPYLSKCLEVRPGAKVLISSADLPGLITDFIVASDSAIATKGEAISQVIAGWQAALQAIKTSPQSTVPTMAKAFRVSNDDMTGFMKVVKWLDNAGNKVLFADAGPAGALSRFAEVNAALRLNNANISQMAGKEFIDPRFVTKL